MFRSCVPRVHTATRLYSLGLNRTSQTIRPTRYSNCSTARVTSIFSRATESIHQPAVAQQNLFPQFQRYSTMSSSVTEQTLANDFLSFIQSSPSQFHAVDTSVQLLLKSGYTQLNERDTWNLKAGGKYFFTRNQSSIVAFAIGDKWKSGNGFSIIASHTDSPVLKLKPNTKVNKHGFHQVAVEPYGGGLWYTWFDRDLSVAGRVIVAHKDGTFHSKLVHVKKSILRIPNLAIHLNREVNDKGFAPNKQTHTVPVLATAIKSELEGKKSDNEAHQPLLLQLLADELKCDVSEIVDFELSLYDTQPAALGGILNEFIYARGLDNLMMSYVGLRSLIDTSNDLSNEETVRVVGLFDNEEVGSESTMGASSNMMFQFLSRVNNNAGTIDQAIRKSLLVSADMAHALHPNYADLHEENHRPHMHKGLVLKYNANQRYATCSITAFFLEQLAKKHQIPVQKFCVRNDMGCGSTIGPILAANCGLRVVDVGIPQLSMHSIREMCGTADVFSTWKLFQAFYKEFAQMDASLKIEGE